MPTYEMFWGQIGEYNHTFVYLHYVWIAVSIPLLLWLFIKPGRIIDAAWKAFLSATFIFTGILFFEVYSVGPVSQFFYGPLFLLVGAFLFIDMFRKRIHFRLPEKKWVRYITFIGLAMVYAYPFFGVALGRSFPYLCMPMDPCPLTVLAIVMITAVIPNIDRKALISLLPWGLLGLPKALGMYGCYEDAILFAAGMYGLVMVVVNRGTIGNTKTSPVSSALSDMGA